MTGSVTRVTAPVDPRAVEEALAAYYDLEGDERLHRPIEPDRLAARSSFLVALAAHGAGRRVLEIGCGPGRDALEFVAAGHHLVGVDLSLGHLRLCAATGALVARATVRALPFPDRCFDAVWTMSTLMHVPDAAIDGALDELARVIRPGGMAAIGVWGGPDVEASLAHPDNPDRPARQFSRRSNERWQRMLERRGDVEEFATWGDGDFFYQWALVRVA